MEKCPNCGLELKIIPYCDGACKKCGKRYILTEAVEFIDAMAGVSSSADPLIPIWEGDVFRMAVYCCDESDFDGHMSPKIVD